MSIISLNCRGLGNPSAVTGLRDIIRREAPAAIFLCETKLSSREMDEVTVRIEGYTDLAVDSTGRSGGLAFLWRKEIKCELRSMTSHHMDFMIHVGDSPWRITRLYGDFNEILFTTEMKGGQRSQRQMTDFREAVDDCGLRDLGYVGYGFTYDNRQADKDNRQTRLDRALATMSWNDLFPRAKLINMDREWSDHAPIKLILNDDGSTPGYKKRLFRFEQLWVGEDGCEDTIREAWSSGETDIVGRLQSCAEGLTK
ncbi:hypothetical protein RND81_14G062000 [Saponaria officinalis]|uniref:Endonuclease/exonuclease/phosphatase domain-containing protein n=1 Tax=Saponaria officinalis TaxID=3572 RepID=A0AAW1GIB8_SAPOF